MSDDGVRPRVVVYLSLVCFALYSYAHPFFVILVVKKLVVNKRKVKILEAAKQFFKQYTDRGL